MLFLEHVSQDTISLFFFFSKFSPLIINPETRTLMLFKAIDLVSVMISVDVSISDLFDPRLFAPQCNMMMLGFLSISGEQRQMLI